MTKVVSKIPVVGGALSDVTNSLGGALGLGSSYDQDPRIASLAATLQNQANSPSSVASAQYDVMAQNAMNNTNRAIASTPGLTPQQAAHIQASSGRGANINAAQNSALIGQQDIQNKQNLLASLLSGQSQLQTQEKENQFARLQKNAQSGAAAATKNPALMPQ